MAEPEGKGLKSRVFKARFKKICKDFPDANSVLEDHVVPFLENIASGLANGEKIGKVFSEVASRNSEINKKIGEFTHIHSSKEGHIVIVKFRVKLPGAGKSKGPRLFVTFVFFQETEWKYALLKCHIHSQQSDKSPKNEPTIEELLSILESTLQEIEEE